MKNQDNVGVTFINSVMSRGIFNDVVNITLGVLNFTPSAETNSVEPDHVIAARLRMDKECAKAMHRELGDLLKMISEETAPPATDVPQEKPKIQRVKAH